MAGHARQTIDRRRSSFRRRVLPVNHSHWYWQPNQNSQETEHKRTQYNAMSSKWAQDTPKNSRPRETASISRLLRHPARKRSGSVLSTQSPHGAAAAAATTTTFGSCLIGLSVRNGLPKKNWWMETVDARFVYAGCLPFLLPRQQCWSAEGTHQRRLHREQSRAVHLTVNGELLNAAYVISVKKVMLSPVRLCLSVCLSVSYSYSYSHTLFKNTQQTCMNKMQMTITKEKKITTHT